MSVDAFTVNGEVTLDTSNFQSAITRVTNKLNELTSSFNKSFDTSAFVNSFQGIKGEFNSLKTIIKEVKTLFDSIIDIPKLVTDMEKVKTELTKIREKVGHIKTDTTSVSNEVNKVAQATVNWSQALATVSPNFQNMASSLELINMKEEQRIAEMGKIGSELIEEGSQIKKNTTYYEQELQVAKQFKNAQDGLISGYVEQGRAIEQANALEKERLVTLKKEMDYARQLGSEYMKISREQNRQLTYEQKALMVEEEFNNLIKFEMETYAETLALQEQIVTLIGDKTAMTGEEIAEETKKLNTLRQELDLNKEIATIEKEETGIIKEQNALLSEQTALNKNNARVNNLDKGNYLGRRIGSMAITMLGYQELMDVWNKTSANINAKTQFNSYADLLKTDDRYLKQTKQSIGDVDKGIQALNKSLTDTYKDGKSLQQMYSKVDMRQVGANALDTAFKYGVQAENLSELTEVMAIYSSEFVRQGRSQEDSILAVNDALDGEFRRLKEVNIGKEDLEARGYKEGDTLSLIRAMREIAEERGYDVTAQKITTLSEAINQAELELAFLVSDLFEMAEPSLIYALGKLVELFRYLGDGAKALKNYLKGLPQPVKDFLKAFGGNAMLGLVGLWIGRKIWGAISNIGLFGDAWSKLMTKLGRTKGIDKATQSMGNMGQTTGGTVSKSTSAKDGIKNWGKNLAKNLGKMAEIFIEVAVAIAMAWALLKEAMYLISDLGKQWESQKADVEKGMEFIKSYGIWILAIGGAMALLLQYTDKLPQTDWKSQGKAFLNLATGLAFAMGLIAEAIVLLALPLGAIAVLGWASSQLDPTAIQKGNEVIGMYADALNYIASDDNIGWFIIGLTVASAVLGFTLDTVAVPLALGIATTLGLVAEAIVLLVLPLLAIEQLGYLANELDESAIQKGSDAIGLVGRALKVLEPSIRNLLVIDFEVFGIGLVEKGNQLVNGKGGLKSLTEDILPTLFAFIQDLSNLEIPTSTDVTAKVQAITTMATQIAPMFTAMQKLNNALGIGGVVGKASTFVGNVMNQYMGTGLKPQLDKLYNDIKDVMDFANKLDGLGSGGNANTTAMTQTANAIAQLKTKLSQFASTITSYATKIKGASVQMGNALPNGFKQGSANFSSTVVGVLANGIGEIQSRYQTFNSGGKALGQKLVDGFKNHKPTLKSITSKEIGYALSELDSQKDDFYNKGKSLGSELTRGYQDGADIHSPGLIARTTARELRYTLDTLDTGKKMMYQGGQALGQALANGYNGNLRTDVGVLAQKGISSEQLKANAKVVQGNGKGNQQNPQLTQTNINIDMSNSTVIGIQDLDAKIRASVEKAIVQINSPNGAIGY